MKRLLIGIFLCIFSCGLFAQSYTVKLDLLENHTFDEFAKIYEYSDFSDWMAKCKDLKVSEIVSAVVMDGKEAQIEGANFRAKILVKQSSADPKKLAVFITYSHAISKGSKEMDGKSFEAGKFFKRDFAELVSPEAPFLLLRHLYKDNDGERGNPASIVISASVSRKD